MDQRASIKMYHDKGYAPVEILKAVQKLKIGEKKVRRTIKRLIETGSIADRKRSGRPRSVRTPSLINKVKCHLWKIPQQSIIKMATQVNASPRILRRVVKDDLGVKLQRKRRLQGLTQQARKKWLVNSKAPLEWLAEEEMDRIVFSDEKLFSVEEKTNSQNVRIYAASIEHIPEEMRTVQRFRKEKKVMIWCGVSKRGKFPLVFIESGTRINASYYKTHILENVVEHQGQLMYHKGL